MNGSAAVPNKVHIIITVPDVCVHCVWYLWYLSVQLFDPYSQQAVIVR